MSDYSDLKRMIEDLVVERDGWKRSCEAANFHWESTRERDEFNRCEAHLRGRKISKLQAQLECAKGDLAKAIRDNEALRKDAERYRWLMSPAICNGTLGIAYGCFDGWIDFEFKDEAEKAIDTAMSAADES